MFQKEFGISKKRQFNDEISASYYHIQANKGT